MEVAASATKTFNLLHPASSLRTNIIRKSIIVKDDEQPFVPDNEDDSEGDAIDDFIQRTIPSRHPRDSKGRTRCNWSPEESDWLVHWVNAQPKDKDLQWVSCIEDIKKDHYIRDFFYYNNHMSINKIREAHRRMVDKGIFRSTRPMRLVLHTHPHVNYFLLYL